MDNILLILFNKFLDNPTNNFWQYFMETEIYLTVTYFCCLVNFKKETITSYTEYIWKYKMCGPHIRLDNVDRVVKGQYLYSNIRVRNFFLYYAPSNFLAYTCEILWEFRRNCLLDILVIFFVKFNSWWNLKNYYFSQFLPCARELTDRYCYESFPITSCRIYSFICFLSNIKFYYLSMTQTYTRRCIQWCEKVSSG